VDVLHEAIVHILKNDATVSAITTKIRPVSIEEIDDVPFIQYEIDEARDEHAANGPVGVIHGTFTIRCFAETYNGCVALDQAVKAALHAAPFTAPGTPIVTTNGSTLIRRLQSQDMSDIPTVGKLGRSKAVRGRMRPFSVTYKPQ
jgi:hypothetical protein